MPSDLSVINAALLRLGVEPAENLVEDSKQRRVMSSLLSDTKDAVLMEFPWAFARRVARLDGEHEPPIPVDFGYAFGFVLPDNCLCVHRVFEAMKINTCVEFIVVDRVLYSNMGFGYMDYTIRVEDVSLWPRQVSECLELRLAVQAAVMLGGDLNKSGDVMQEYGLLLQKAVATSVVQENIAPAMSHV